MHFLFHDFERQHNLMSVNRAVIEVIPFGANFFQNTKNEKIEIIYRTMFSEYPDIVTIKQLRQMLGISRTVAYELLSTGQIKGLKIANAYRIPKVSIIDFIVKSSKLNE